MTGAGAFVRQFPDNPLLCTCKLKEYMHLCTANAPCHTKQTMCFSSLIDLAVTRCPRNSNAVGFTLQHTVKSTAGKGVNRSGTIRDPKSATPFLSLKALPPDPFKPLLLVTSFIQPTMHIDSTRPCVSCVLTPLEDDLLGLLALWF